MMERECEVCARPFAVSQKSPRQRFCSLRCFNMRRGDIPRFVTKYAVDATTGCWVWTGSCTPDGYGHFSVAGKQERAHRWSYQHHKGPIPAGLSVDHLCGNTRCVNPDHLEAVPIRVNILRGNGAAVRGMGHKQTHCKRGHPLDGSPIDRVTNARRCRVCGALRAKRYRERARVST